MKRAGRSLQHISAQSVAVNAESPAADAMRGALLTRPPRRKCLAPDSVKRTGNGVRFENTPLRRSAQRILRQNNTSAYSRKRESKILFPQTV
jgi:hypothetical protein